MIPQSRSSKLARALKTDLLRSAELGGMRGIIAYPKRVQAAPWLTGAVIGTRWTTRSNRWAGRRSHYALGLLFTQPVYPGQGATATLGREMAALGLEGPALIIAGRTVIGRSADTWKSSLDEARTRHTMYRFSGECSTAEIEGAKSHRSGVRSPDDRVCRRR